MAELRGNNMKNVISDYLAVHHLGSVKEEEFFASRKTLREAISYAALAKDDESKFSHQYRVKNEALKNSQTILLKHLNQISKCKSFHQLFLLVESLISSVNGIGPLTIYDTAVRIGFKLKLYPEFIYLHAGTRDGARNLGLPTNVCYLEINQVPRPLRKLKPDQIESILCIYKNRLCGVGNERTARSRC